MHDMSTPLNARSEPQSREEAFTDVGARTVMLNQESVARYEPDWSTPSHPSLAEKKIKGAHRRQIDA